MRNNQQNEPTVMPLQSSGTGKAERLRLYRKTYWQLFKRRHVRVYGTLTKAEYAEIKLIAENSGRSVWTQIWCQSLAFQQSRYLPTTEVQTRIERLYGQLRSIGNNLNQIARQGNALGHIKSPRDVLRQIETLEAVIADFVERPWKKR